MLLALAWALSEDRARVPWRIVGASLLLSLLLCMAVLWLPWVRSLFSLLDGLVVALDAATASGTALVFGYLGGAPVPFAESGSGSTFILALRALPIVLVISALSALLFHWRVLPWMVGLFARALVSGTLTTCITAALVGVFTP